MSRHRIEVLPGKFIKYEISEELAKELSNQGVNAHLIVEQACEHLANVYRQLEKNNAAKN